MAITHVLWASDKPGQDSEGATNILGVIDPILVVSMSFPSPREAESPAHTVAIRALQTKVKG